MIKTKYGKRVATGVLAGALALGGVFAATAPAMAAGSGKTEVSLVRAEAWTWTSGGTQGRSYAQHGCASSLSQWGSSTSNAWASCGLSSGTAWYQFR
ncbi:MAG: hypothetical protein J0I43_10810 [Microbacterium sp.]|uniref:hypothetical protein n=1 Tax=Microbacterium sp. TaxID=51671 RepID=UPI001AD09968|nr:hypothetical protein [Microbacterium sp.]MBN9177845.1 hypothetical protein [Microbacterium sp.]